MRALYLFLLCLIPTVATASTLGEELNMDINQISSTDFEVLDGPRMGPHEYWCGAASYNEVRRGGSELAMLYIRKPRSASVTAPGRKSVVFTTDPRGLTAQKGLTVNVDRAGLSMKSASARRLCRDAFTRSTK